MSYLRDRSAVLCALLGAILVVVGVGWMYPPAGVIVGGCALIVVAYVARYLEVQQRETS